MNVSRKILWVDDDANMLQAMRRTFHGKYELMTCTSGHEALEMLHAQGPFAVVVSDYHMPRMNGVQFLTEVRRVAPESVGIMLTILADLRVAVRALHEAGIYRFLNKPCPTDILQATLDDALEHYRLMRREHGLVEELEVANGRLRGVNAQLAEAHRKALEASQTKSNFLATMSHEIRTPMTAILGFAEEVLSTEMSEGERRSAVETIRRNGRHLLSIVNDILDLSKIEAAKMEILPRRVSLPGLIAEVGSLMRGRARAKGLEFVTEFNGMIPETIHVDDTRLKQILINLLGNALKFTDTGSIGIRVFGRACRDGHALTIDVFDTGPGMTTEELDVIFEPFQQGRATMKSAADGTGLGLAISQRLAQLLRIAVEVTSERGHGSQFRLSLPMGATEGHGMLTPAQALEATTIAREPELAPLPKVMEGRVLLAEDGPDNQRLIGSLLRRAGLDVTIVEDGQQAAEQALAGWRDGPPFDVILMDMQMPVLDGYEATRFLRAQGYTYPILALTANAMVTERSACLEAGCDDFLSKPIDRVLLMSSIAEHLKLVRLREGCLE